MVNNINILNLSLLDDSFLHGSFSQIEAAASFVPYCLNGQEFDPMFWLADGIYPEWTCPIQAMGWRAATPSGKKVGIWDPTTTSNCLHNLTSVME